MLKLLIGVTVLAVLAGCHSPHARTASDAPADASAVQAGTTKDSVNPDLNALQRTKRTVNAINALQNKNMSQALGSPTQ